MSPAHELDGRQANQPAARPRRAVFDPASGALARSIGIVERDALCAGDRVAGPAVIVERETSTVVTTQLRRRHPERRRHPSGPQRQPSHERHQRHPHAGDVEPADLGGRGAGADAAAHRLLDLGARGRRPVGRRVRPARARCWRRRSPARPATSTPWPGGVHFINEIPGARPCARATSTSPTIPGRAPAICTTSPWCRRPSGTASWSRSSPAPRMSSMSAAAASAPTRSQVYEEGIYIPIMKFAETGKVNADLVDIVRANVREPIQVVGDFYSLAACNEVGHRRLVDMMDEFGLDDLDELGDLILAQSRAGDAGGDPQAAEAATYTQQHDASTATTRRSTWSATVTIGDDGIDVDFAGTSRRLGLRHQRADLLHRGLYPLRRQMHRGAARSRTTRARCRVIRVHRAGGLHPQRASIPAPVAARHVIGQMLPDVVFGACTRRCPARCRPRAPRACGTCSRSAARPHRRRLRRTGERRPSTS